MSLSETTKYVAAVGAAREEKITFRAMNAKGEHQDVCGIKANLMLASPVLRSMLSENWRQHQKVEIANFQAETLQLLVEFVENFQLVSSVGCQDLVKLVVAADYFMIKSLEQYCTKQLGPKVGICDVWPLLDALCLYKHLDSVVNTCVPVLQEKTLDCISHPSFLLARQESLFFLLKQDPLSLTSEHQLLHFCWCWSLQQPNPQFAMGDLLTHLRLDAEFKGRMVRLIDLKPTDDDFAAQFDLKMASSARTLICRNSRKFTSKEKKVILGQIYHSTFLNDSDCLFILTSGESLQCAMCLIAKDDILLVSLRLPILYEHEPIWKAAKGALQQQYYECTGKDLVACEFSITMGRKACVKNISFPLCIANTSSSNDVELPSPRQMLRDQELTIQCRLKVSKTCLVKIRKGNIDLQNASTNNPHLKVCKYSGELVVGLSYYKSDGYKIHW